MITLREKLTYITENRKKSFIEQIKDDGSLQKYIQDVVEPACAAAATKGYKQANVELLFFVDNEAVKSYHDKIIAAAIADYLSSEEYNLTACAHARQDHHISLPTFTRYIIDLNWY